MPSKISCHLYDEVDCSIFMATSPTLNPYFFQYICPKIGHQANPGMVCLTRYPLSFETKNKELFGCAN